MNVYVKSFAKASIKIEFVLSVALVFVLTFHRNKLILGNTESPTFVDLNTKEEVEPAKVLSAPAPVGPNTPAPSEQRDTPQKKMNSYWKAPSPDSVQGKWISKIKKIIKQKSLTNIVVTEGSGSLVLKIAGADIDPARNRLSPTLESKLRDFFPEVIKVLATSKEFKGKVNKIKILGFGPVKKKKDNVIDYDYSSGLVQAKSVYRYLFNVSKLTYEHQDFAVARATTSGNGLRYLAREMTAPDTKDYLFSFCKKYNCKQPNKIMFRVYFKGDKS